MSDQKKPDAPRRPRRLRSNPPIPGFVHGVQFNNDGVTVDPVTEKEENRLRETFTGVEFTPVEEPAAQTEGAK